MSLMGLNGPLKKLFTSTAKLSEVRQVSL